MLPIIALVCVAAMVAPTPPKPPKTPPKPAPEQQGASVVVIVPPSPRTNIIAWKYPAGLVPSNYWWNVESSTDLRHWSVVIRNATGAYQVTAKKTDRLRAYRISGRLTP